VTSCAASPGRSLAVLASVVAFATAVVVATEFIVVGLLPPMARDLAITLPSAGHFVSAFALGSAIFGPLLMIPASRWEPRRVMALALVPFVLGNVAAAAMPGYWVVLAVRVLEGATLPVLVSTGSAALAGLAGPGREGWAVSLVYLGVVAGLVVALPAGTALAGTLDWRMSFVALGSLALAAMIALALGFPRLGSGQTSVAGELSAVRRPAVLAHLALSALIFAAMFAPYTYLAAMLEGPAGLGAIGIAWALMGFGLAGIPGNSAAGFLSDRGPTRATAWAALLLALTLVAVPYAATSLPLLLPVLAIWGAVHAAVFLLCQMRVMQSAPDAPAFAGTLNISAANLGIAAGGAFGGEMLTRGGIEAVTGGGAVLALLALAFAVVLRKAGER
jgi:predicted MFS family arabinose efflux permease